MKLSQYLIENNISKNKFAKAIGVDRSNFNKYLKKMPQKHWDRITELTNGAVMLMDLYIGENDEERGNNK